ncbi:hypothetical protein AB4Z34_29250 [Ensifer sp. 2YAB10]|uniref:hypothetical protein n=1 Tax=unclassified Ensifer TaxID=2633371 RepID=UPI003F932890
MSGITDKQPPLEPSNEELFAENEGLKKQIEDLHAVHGLREIALRNATRVGAVAQTLTEKERSK